MASSRFTHMKAIKRARSYNHCKSKSVMKRMITKLTIKSGDVDKHDELLDEEVAVTQRSFSHTPNRQMTAEGKSISNPVPPVSNVYR